MGDTVLQKEVFKTKKKKNKAGLKTNFFCEFCNRQIQGKDNYDEHNDSAFHKERKKLLQDALLSKKHYCYTCDKICPTKVGLDTHCLLLRHLQLYRVHGIVKSLETSDSLPLMNEPIVSSVEARVLQTPSDSVTRSKPGGKTDEESTITQVKKTDIKVKKSMFYCRICDVDCGCVENFKSHVESWKHRANVDNLREANLARRYVEEEPEVKVEDSPAKPISLTEKGNFFCDVCCIPCTGKVNYHDHLNGKRHHRKVSQMKPPFRCYSCNEKYATEREFKEHLASDAHIRVTFKVDTKREKGGFRKEKNKLTTNEDFVSEVNKASQRTSIEDRNDRKNSRSKRRSRDIGRVNSERRSRDKEKKTKYKHRQRRQRSNSSYSSSSESRNSDSGNSREGSVSRRERKGENRKDSKSAKKKTSKSKSEEHCTKIGKVETKKIGGETDKVLGASLTEEDGVEFGDDNRKIEVINESDGLPKLKDLREKLSAGKANLVITKLVDRSEKSPPKGEAGKEEWTVDNFYSKSELAAESKDMQRTSPVPLAPGKELIDSADELSVDAIDQLHRDSIAKREKLLDEREAALLRFHDLEEEYKKFELEWEYLKRRLELHDVDEEERKAETIDLAKVEYILKDIQRELRAQETLIKDKERQVLFEREHLHKALEREEQRRESKLESTKDVNVFVKTEERALDGQCLPPPQSLWSAPKVEKVKQEKLVFEYGNKSMLHPAGAAEFELKRSMHVASVALDGPNSVSGGIDYYPAHSVVNTQKEKKIDQGISVEQDKDLRRKLDKERLLKRIQPELEGVDPVLRARILRAILTTEGLADSGESRALASPTEKNNQAGNSLDNTDTFARKTKEYNFDKGEKARALSRPDVTSSHSGRRSEVDDDMFDSLVFARDDESGLSSRPPIDVGMSTESNEGNLHYSPEHARFLEGHLRSFTEDDSSSKARKRRSGEKDRGFRRRERSRSREDRHKNRRKRSRSDSHEGRRGRSGKRKRSRRSRGSSRSSQSAGSDSNVDSSKESSNRSKGKGGKSQGRVLLGSVDSKQDHAISAGGHFRAESSSGGVNFPGKDYFAAQSLAGSGFNLTTYHYGVGAQSQLPGLTHPTLAESSLQGLTATSVFPPYSGWNQRNPLTTNMALTPLDAHISLPERRPAASAYGPTFGLATSVYPGHAISASNQPFQGKPLVSHPGMTRGILPEQAPVTQPAMLVPPPPIPLPSNVSAKFASGFYQKETETSSINPYGMSSRGSLQSDQFDLREQKVFYDDVHQSHVPKVVKSPKPIDDANYGQLKDEKTVRESLKVYMPTPKHESTTSREGTPLTSRETGTLQKTDSSEMAFRHTDDKQAEFFHVEEDFESSYLNKPGHLSLERVSPGLKAAALDIQRFSLTSGNSNSEERSADISAMLKLWKEHDLHSQLSHDAKGYVKKSILKQPTRQFKERPEEFRDPEEDSKSTLRGQYDTLEELRREKPSPSQQQLCKGDRDSRFGRPQEALFSRVRDEDGLRKKQGEEIPLLQVGRSPSFALWSSSVAEASERRKEQSEGQSSDMGSFDEHPQQGVERLRGPVGLDSSVHVRTKEHDPNHQRSKDKMREQDTYPGLSARGGPYEVVRDRNNRGFPNFSRTFDKVPQQVSEGSQDVKDAQVPSHEGRPVIDHGDPSTFVAERSNESRSGDDDRAAPHRGMMESGGGFRRHHPDLNLRSQPLRQGLTVKGSEDVKSSTESRTPSALQQSSRQPQSWHEVARSGSSKPPVTLPRPGVECGKGIAASQSSKLPFLCSRCQLTFGSEKALEYHNCRIRHMEAKNDEGESTVNIPFSRPDYSVVANSDKVTKDKDQELVDLPMFGENVKEAETHQCDPLKAGRTGEARYSGAEESYRFESGILPHMDQLPPFGEHFHTRQTSAIQDMRGRQIGQGRVSVPRGRGRGRGVPAGSNLGARKVGSYPDNSRREELRPSGRRISDEQLHYRGGMPARLRGTMRLLSHRGRPSYHPRGRP